MARSLTLDPPLISGCSCQTSGEDGESANREGVLGSGETSANVGHEHPELTGGTCEALH